MLNVNFIKNGKQEVRQYPDTVTVWEWIQEEGMEKFPLSVNVSNYVAAAAKAIEKALLAKPDEEVWLSRELPQNWFEFVRKPANFNLSPINNPQVSRPGIRQKSYLRRVIDREKLLARQN